MKKLTITLITLAFLGFAMAEKPSFENSIAETLSLYQKAKSKEEIQQIVSRFQRIAQAENDQWLAHYYVAFTAIDLCFNEQDGKRKDAILDEAQKSIDKAKELNGNKSDIYTLQGFLYQGRIGVSPMRRGRSYSEKAGKALEKAISENSNNPRAYYLMGMNVYNIPAFFGGGSKNALPHFKKADKLFATESNTNKGIEPSWGNAANKRMLEKCLND